MTAPPESIEPRSGVTGRADEGGLSELKDLPLREIIGSLPDYILIVDRELKVLLANRLMALRTPQQLEGLHVGEVFPAPLQPLAMATLHRVLATGETGSFPAEIEGRDGTLRHFAMRISPVKRDDRVVALMVSATETTSQVRAEKAIATQARMIESMLEGVAVIDERGVIEITNPAFDAMFGHERGALIGRQMSTLAGWPFERPERWRSEDEASVRVEFEGHRLDGTVFAAAGVLSKFEVAGSDHSLLVLQDVSERKQLERAILQAVNREQYRIGNDLHDGLGQELTGIALMLRGVAGRLSSEYPRMLPDIESIMHLVNNAIESTRALARGLSPVNLERGGLIDALEGLAMQATEVYGVPTRFTRRMQSAHPLSAEVANHLYRVAQEAVRNAVRHGAARSIRLHLSSARAKVTLSITDDGTGMPPGALDSAGMGLKIMQYRARILGGEVRFENLEPSGTRVICDVPAEPARTTESAPRRARRRAVASSS